jgi:hypothetical protein
MNMPKKPERIVSGWFPSKPEFTEPVVATVVVTVYKLLMKPPNLTSIPGAIKGRAGINAMTMLIPKRI